MGLSHWLQQIGKPPVRRLPFNEMVKRPWLSLFFHCIAVKLHSLHNNHHSSKNQQLGLLHRLNTLDANSSLIVRILSGQSRRDSKHCTTESLPVIETYRLLPSSAWQ